MTLQTTQIDYCISSESSSVESLDTNINSVIDRTNVACEVVSNAYNKKRTRSRFADVLKVSYEIKQTAIANRLLKSRLVLEKRRK